MIREIENIKIIKHFATIIECKELIVTGSHVLHLMGMSDDAPGDLDILLVEPTNSAVAMLKRLESEGPFKQIESYEGTELLVRIEYDGIKVDFFSVKHKDIKYIQTKDCCIATVGQIVKAKKKYGRLKDWVQLRNMAKFFSKESDFMKYIDEINPV